ncbi:MAG: hypothetical protein ACYSWZ_05270 [Planctomycetota bacterium]|jgi:hypothetical protein
MKSLTYVLKITAIALNTYFSAWVLLFVCSGYGGGMGGYSASRVKDTKESDSPDSNIPAPSP